jgi:tetratricopeptide (TPR) repeat protein
VLVIITLVLLGAGTLSRNTEYRTGLGLWQTVLDRRPQARAHTNIAVYFRDAGQVDEALRHLQIAAPDWADARFPLGSALLERGDVGGGIAQIEAFIRLRPNHPQIISAREELANALFRLGNTDQAIEELRHIVAAAPDYARGHANLGSVLASRKDFDGAAEEYREALRGRPDSPTALPVLIDLGQVLIAGRHDDEAISVLQRALRVDPRNVAARRELLQPLFNQRRFADLEAESRTLLASLPNDADAHNQLGIALASQNRLNEAIGQFAEAVRLNPDLRSARNNLALALDVQRRSSATPPRR